MYLRYVEDRLPNRRVFCFDGIILGSIKRNIVNYRHCLSVEELKALLSSPLRAANPSRRPPLGLPNGIQAHVPLDRGSG